VVYDAIPEVRERYVTHRKDRKRLEIWKPDRCVRFMKEGSILRVQGNEPFRIRWSVDAWRTQSDTQSCVNRMEIDFVDLSATQSLPKGGGVEFTLFWLTSNRWEGRDYRVVMR
jgi:glucoamylase